MFIESLLPVLLCRKKTFFISLVVFVFSACLYAKVDVVSYKATFGVFGTVGTIKNKITKTQKHLNTNAKTQTQKP